MNWRTTSDAPTRLSPHTSKGSLWHLEEETDMGGRWVSRDDVTDGAMDWASRDRAAREDYALNYCNERGCRRRTRSGAPYCLKHAPRRPEGNPTSEH